MERFSIRRNKISFFLLFGLISLSIKVTSDEFSIDLSHIKSMAPPPGLIINEQNFEEYKNLLDDEFVETFIKNGWVNIEVGETFSLRPHENFVTASKSNMGKASLGNEPGVLNGYISGRPFSAETLNEEDPRSGTRLIWNMRYGYAGDGGRIPEMYWQYRSMRKQELERELEFEAEGMRFMYRHVVEPMPAIKKNPYEIYNAITLTALSPTDVAGTKLLIFYNSDDLAEEQGWMYVPLLRRVRRVATTMRTDSFLGSDIMIEDFLGYTGRVKDMEWTFKGERHILLPVYRHDKIYHADRKARKFDYKFVDFHGHSGCFPNVTWQTRKVYILEGFQRGPIILYQRGFFTLTLKLCFLFLGNFMTRPVSYGSFYLAAWPIPIII